LFRRTIKIGSDTELLIFITPFIIKEAKLTPEEKAKVGRFKEMKRELLYKEEKRRMDFLDGAEPFSLRY